MNVCRQENVVVACSALKKKYRDILANTDKGEEHVKEIAFVRSTPLALKCQLSHGCWHCYVCLYKHCLGYDHSLRYCLGYDHLVVQPNTFMVFPRPGLSTILAS